MPAMFSFAIIHLDTDHTPLKKRQLFVLVSFVLGGDSDLIQKSQRQGKVAADQKGTESLAEISSEQSMFCAASSGHHSKAAIGLDRPSRADEHFHANCIEKSDWKGREKLSLQ